MDMGQNPMNGVTFDYYLNQEQDSTELKLEVLQDGKVIRTVTNQKDKDFVFNAETSIIGVSKITSSSGTEKSTHAKLEPSAVCVCEPAKA